MSKKTVTPADMHPNTSELTGRISTIIETARSRVKTVIDTEMVRAYWEIGREIVEDEQKGAKRAGYGKALLARVSGELTAQYGEGFDARNLRFMRQFYQTYPNWNAVRSELSWTHYRLLMRHDDQKKRSFYEIESVNSNCRGILGSPTRGKVSGREHRYCASFQAVEFDRFYVHNANMGTQYQVLNNKCVFR